MIHDFKLHLVQASPSFEANQNFIEKRNSKSKLELLDYLIAARSNLIAERFPRN